RRRRRRRRVRRRRVARRARRLAVEQAHHGAPEVPAGLYYVGHHLVGAPFLRRRPLGEARRRHGAGGGAQLGHRRPHLVDDLRRRELGGLGLQISADALLLVGHQRDLSTNFWVRLPVSTSVV